MDCDHADPAVGRERGGRHLAIAGLEDVERRAHTRKKNHV
jgi:hypothetical protein